MAPWILAGLPIPQHLLEAHVYTEVVEPSQVMPAALRWAKSLIECSPDAVQITKGQISLWREGKGVEAVVTESMDRHSATYAGPNVLEGLKAFGEVRCLLESEPTRDHSPSSFFRVQRRSPVWTNPSRSSKL